jgi:hypothetical protein
MNFTEAIIAIKSGFKIRRPSWSWASTAYIECRLWHDVPTSYINNRFWNETHPMIYGFTMSDIDATDWEIVE